MDYEGVYIAPGAYVLGDVSIGPGCGIWYNAVVRGDCCPIIIGKNSNIQDNSVVHGELVGEVRIGNGVVIGHTCVIHGCEIGDNCLIGMGSIIMNRAVIGKNCIIGAGSLVTEDTVIPEGSMAFGRPAKVIRPLTEEEIEGIRQNALWYSREAAGLLENEKSL